jgi:hypothetical protein
VRDDWYGSPREPVKRPYAICALRKTDVVQLWAYVIVSKVAPSVVFEHSVHRMGRQRLVWLLLESVARCRP